MNFFEKLPSSGHFLKFFKKIKYLTRKERRVTTDKKAICSDAAVHRVLKLKSHIRFLSGCGSFCTLVNIELINAYGI